MLFLLGTSIFSGFVSGSPELDAQLARLGVEDRTVICTTVRGEVLYGLERLPQGKKRQVLEEKVRLVLECFSCEATPPAAASEYARIKVARQRKGLGLDENDLWIASTALAIGAVLVTRDADFQDIPGLQVVDWSKRVC